MSIEKIIKKFTNKEREKRFQEIKETKIPNNLKKTVEEYKKVGKRNDYLWLWAYKSLKLITLSSVKKEYYEQIWELKFLLVIFITLIDDVADNMKNKELLKEILKISFEVENIRMEKLDKTTTQYMNFTKKIWNDLSIIINKLPRFKEFKKIWEFDIAQTFNTMKYADAVNNNPSLINEVEYWLYFPHNIQFVLSATIDLMCSPKSQDQKNWQIREASWRAQKIAQAINWLTTWERELKSHDFTSGVFAYAVKNYFINSQDFQKEKFEQKCISKNLKTIEKQIVKQCDYEYRQIEKLKKCNPQFNVKLYLKGISEYVKNQLVSKGNY